MNAYEKIKDLEEQEFKLITGVSRKVFGILLEILKARYAEDHAQGGAPGLPVEVRLTLALEYWREYRSQRHMAVSHQIPKSTVNDAILWVEYRLEESEEINLKELKERFKPNEEGEVAIKVVLVDVEEQPVERPKYEQSASY
jgi:hypothetical protein